jgi:SWI/SNF-related matrix-associated actin-dependent regulator of chromatin subfamily A3
VNARLVPNQAYTLPADPPSRLFADGLAVVPLGVALTGDYLELFHDGHMFARINTVSCKDLRPLWDLRIELSAFLDLSSWNALFRVWASKHWQDSAAMFEVELNVYSPRENADKVGQALSKATIFLQRPIFLFKDVLHYNPQLLEVPGYIPCNEAVNDGNDESRENSSTPEETERSGARSRRRRRDALETVLDSLSHNEIQHEIRADDKRILKSELLP